MKKQKLSTPPIPLATAIKEAANWRAYCKKLLRGEKGQGNADLPVMKAFFVPIADLQEVLDLAKNDSGKEVAGMRLYFRLANEDDNLSNLQAMIVPVVFEPDLLYLKDWTERRHATADEDPSLVFDFTKPCPTECDNLSPLV
ncbi:MAG: hypothetical protein Q8941_24585 [Bacteroidota bacterium]|nr:hypothetical protein [Bacteroidota bacterium]